MRTVGVAARWAQFALHFVYGEETFLYSLHFVPLLILLASFSVFTPLGRGALPVSIMLVGLLFWHNSTQFDRAQAIASSLLFKAERDPFTQRQQVLSAMKERPANPWPRGRGHVPIGLPGTHEDAKGWIEPGGSFSPGERSFGVSIWVRGRNGIQTSDNLPLSGIRQTFVGSGPADGVGVHVDAAPYSLEWRQRRVGEWALKITPKADDLELAFRSVGPAGGPVETGALTVMFCSSTSDGRSPRIRGCRSLTWDRKAREAGPRGVRHAPR
jgi:hypothetical protein